MWPGLPTSLSGAYVIGAIDEQVQGRTITRLGKPWGIFYDDTTPDLEHWLALALGKYPPVGQRIMVCVPPGRPDHRYPEPIISVYEWYPYGSGAPRSAWPKLPPRGFPAYIAQARFPGVVSNTRLTRAQRLGVLAGVLARHPRFIFLF